MQRIHFDLKDYHTILGLEHDAGIEEIKHAYRMLAKKYHPDVNPSPDAHDRFIEITEAYEILINKSLLKYHEGSTETVDPDIIRAEYAKARQEAKENARRYARMKYEKFRQEQEAFKKSGWHDVILTIRYFIRILVFPIIFFLIATPLLSEAVASHPSGLIIFWLIAAILIFFVINNWKSYLRLDPYYYHVSDFKTMIRNTAETTGEKCYYCKGHQAISFPYKISFFRIKNLRLKYYGALYGRSVGMDRIFRTVRIPRSRKAVIVHILCSLVKLLSIFVILFLNRKVPYSYYSLPAGILAGSILAGILTALLSTRPKVNYLFSPGMIIKIIIWLVAIYFFGEYALLLLFFDPMIEAILRQISRDKLFLPVFKQHPQIEASFKRRYQLYLELPVWSVINPFLRWLF